MKAGANSGKKQRLKLQVARSTQRSTTRRTPSDTVTIESTPAHDFRLKGVPTDLFTVFHVREAQYEVDKRIIAARQPLSRRPHDEDTQLYQQLIDIPTRPAWHESMKARKLHEVEEAAFESYLTNLYAQYPPTRLNHFEHNLQVWRQLWRVCEMSDVLVISADARHPLFHFPPSLYRYVVDMGREVVLVLNKVDLIDGDTLKGWVEWFKRKFPALEVVCFSSFPNGEAVVSDEVDLTKKRRVKRETGKRTPAGVTDLMALLERKLREKLAKAKQAEKAKAEEERKEDPQGGTAPTPSSDSQPQRSRGRSRVKDSTGAVPAAPKEPERKEAPVTEESADDAEQTAASSAATPQGQATTTPSPAEVSGASAQRPSRQKARLTASTNAAASTSSPPADVSTIAADAADGDANDPTEQSEEDDELVTLHAPAPVRPSRASILIVGVIGHPNAGKSSLLNSLFGRAVVSASDTPGHTKHLQTLALTPTIAVVDSPGLVFPAVDMPRELQALCGIFPIQQLREPYSAIAYLAERVPLERVYALKRVREEEGRGKKKGTGEVDDGEVREVGRVLEVEEAEEEWSAWELCESYARQRNFSIAGSNGRFDTHKAAIEMLYDVLSGAVVFNFAPPAADAEKAVK